MTSRPLRGKYEKHDISLLASESHDICRYLAVYDITTENTISRRWRQKHTPTDIPTFRIETYQPNVKNKIMTAFRLLKNNKQLTTRSRGLPEKLKSRNSPRFTEPEGSSQHSQEPATCPYPQPDRSTPCLWNPTSRRHILIISSHLCLGLSSGLLPSGLPITTLYTPLLPPPPNKIHEYDKYENRDNNRRNGSEVLSAADVS